MVEVRIFRAASMQEALAQVRRELGLEAVVLQTRELTRGRLLRRRQQVEVTASVGVQAAGQAGAPAGGPTPFASPQQASALIDRRALVPRRDAGIDLLSETANAAAGTTDPAVSTLAATAPAAMSPAADAEALAERLDTIEELLVEFSRRTSGRSSESVPRELFHHYTRLIEADVPEQHARSLVLELHQQTQAASGCVPEEAVQRLRGLIKSHICCCGPITVESGRRKVVALVGPTGVGKTTTIAKLAANFRLRDGIRLGLVTVDTYRVAAVEQLRTYADIIDLPMKVVTSPLEMRRAIDELSDMDLVLIDTAGRSPREELQLQELKALLGEAEVDQVHLVLSLATSSRVLKMTAEKFAGVGVSSLILTKLDEAVGMGALLGVARELKIPLSYLTTGQGVPDDIETASAARASRLILGEDALFARRRHVHP
jgi:flagellar biosynthesis protein FlhF